MLIDLEVESRGHAAFGPVASAETKSPFILKPTASSSTGIRGTLRPRARWCFKRRRHRFGRGHSIRGQDRHDELAVGGRYDRQPAAAGPSQCGSRRNHEAASSGRSHSRTHDPGAAGIESDQATFFLRDDNTVDRILAEGDVESDIHGTLGMPRAFRPRRMWLTGTRNQLTTAVLTGNVQSSSREPGDRSPPTLPPDARRCTLPGSKCSRRFMPKTACGCRRRRRGAGSCVRDESDSLVASIEATRAKSCRTSK